MSDAHVSVRMSEALRSRLNLASEVTGRKPSDLIREAIKAKCDELLTGQPLSVVLRDYIGVVAS